MARNIQKISPANALTPTLSKVAAYARVSSGKDAMLHSLSAQISYYNDYIQSQPGWIFAGIYADEALTGTKDNRAEFHRLLDDCRKGNVNKILTKSISRFARNTVTLLETVRELKALGVDVYFEEQNIHSMSSDGELMLTILASYAQEESRSASENQKWRVKRNFEEGMPWKGAMLGYRYDRGKYNVIPEEAKIVQDIYRFYLDGCGVPLIIRRLKEQGATTEMGNTWSRSSITKILRNYTYTGNLLLQRFYRENHLSKRTLINHGELPQYHAEGTHEAIIDMDTFLSAQEEILHRAEKYCGNTTAGTYPFTGKLICAGCGKHYRRKTRKNGVFWICSTYNALGKAHCDSKQIPESTLYELCADVLGTDNFDVQIFSEELQALKIHNGNRIQFCFRDGSEADRIWSDRSRSESWTPEMRTAAGTKTRKRHQEAKQWQERM